MSVLTRDEAIGGHRERWTASATAVENVMLDHRKPPNLCRTMLDVRAGVDQIDREILTLIGERFRFMEAAARIKPGRDRIRDEARKVEVLGNVAGHAAANGVPADLAVQLYERLIEASIAHELECYDDRASAAAAD